MGVIINTEPKKSDWVLIDTETITSVTTVSKTITADLSKYTEFMIGCGYGNAPLRIDESTMIPADMATGTLQSNATYQGNIMQYGYIGYTKSSKLFTVGVTWLRSGQTVTTFMGYLFAR